MHVTKVPSRVNTDHGTLDSEIMVSQTVGTIIKIFTRTRGLNKKQARSLLIKAFCKDLLSSLEEESYVSEVNTLLNKWLLKYI